MNNTNFSVIESQKSSDFAKPYAERKDEVKEIPFANISAVGPAGSINSSVSDMSNWMILQLGGGKFNGKQIISESSINQMQSPQMVIPSGVSDEVYYSSYGMGWMITSYRGHLRVEHGGNIDGFSASVCLLPKDSVGIVVLTNMDGTNLPAIVRNFGVDKILELSEIDWNKKLIDSKEKSKDAKKEGENKPDPNRVEGTTPSHKLEEYTGKFTHPAYGEINIAMNGSDLEADFHGQKAKMSHYHYDIFSAYFEEYSETIKLNFHTSDKGEIFKITVPLQDGVKDIEFTRVIDVKKMEKSDLEKFLGEYDISGTIIKVTLRGESTLIMTVPGQPDYELIPLGNQVFNIKGLEGYSVKFNQDGDKVSEIVFNQPNGVFSAKKK